MGNLYDVLIDRVENNKLRVFEAFAGVGSQSMALRNINCNYEVVGISDVDRYALLAYDAIHCNQYEVDIKSKEEMLKEIKQKNIAYNFSTGKSEIPRSEKDIKKLYDAHVRSKNFGDIRLINPNDLPDFDLFTYSFPCKNISVAGQQGGLEEGSGTQSALIWECKKIIEAKRPKYLMMENVKNIIGKKHKPILDMWCKVLEDLGYRNFLPEGGYLNGKDFGVPQNRERVIMISIREDVNSNFEFPKGKDTGIRLKDVLESNVNEKYYISKDKFIIKNKILLHNPSIGASRGRYVNENGKKVTKQHLEINKKGVSNSLTTVQTDNLVIESKNELIQVGMLNIKGNESNRRVYYDAGLCPTLNSMNGGNRQPKVLIPQATKKGYIELTLPWVADLSYPNSKTRRGRVQNGGNITPTITATQQDICLINEDYLIRKLTPLECWRLMGFKDDDFNKAKNVGLSESKLYERAGRGIVVPMLEEIFKNLFSEYIGD